MARKQLVKKKSKRATKSTAKKSVKKVRKSVSKATTKTSRKRTAKAKTKKVVKTAQKTGAKATVKRRANKSTSKKRVRPVVKPAPKRKLDFKPKQFVVYPAHGVGQVTEVEEQEVAGTRIELFVVQFDKDRMTLRVPTAKAKNVGMRPLSSADTVKSALETLKGRARIKRTMWSRRAQEYEAKINSGDLISIAEVVRDLHRASGQPEQSYSERQLYEAALDRMVREVSAVEKLEEEEVISRVEAALEKAAAA